MHGHLIRPETLTLNVSEMRVAQPKSSTDSRLRNYGLTLQRFLFGGETILTLIFRAPSRVGGGTVT
jgi:hypothetical protein